MTVVDIASVEDDVDLAALAALRAAWSAEDAMDPVDATDRVDGGVDDGSAYRDDFATWATSERRVFILARTDDGTPVGMCNIAVIRRMPKPGSPSSCWAYLANMYVLEPYRNAGVGADILAVAVEHARGLKAVRLVTSPSGRSRRFYARHGFASADALAVLPMD